MGTTNTPSMGLILPNVSQEPGPQWATDINQSFTQVDSHNHAPGQGVPINSNGLAITQDLSLNSVNLTNTRTVRFNNTVTASSGTDLNCLFVNGSNLLYRDNYGALAKINSTSVVLNPTLFAASSGFFNTLRTSAILFPGYSISQSGSSLDILNNSVQALSVQPTGGVILSSTYGLSAIGQIGTSAYFGIDSAQSQADVGQLRLCNNNVIGWRNSQDTGNILLTIDATNSFVFKDGSGNTYFKATSAGRIWSGDDGAQALPAFAFNAEQNTGIYRIGVGSIGVTATGTIVSILSKGGVSILGTTASNNASAGFVGEYASSANSGLTNYPASGAYGDATNITLSAGDWDVTANCVAVANGATVTNCVLGISTTSGNDSTGLSLGNNRSDGGPTTVNGGIVVPSYRISTSATTTYYLKVLSAYTGGPPQYAYRISGRRVR